MGDIVHCTCVSLYQRKGDVTIIWNIIFEVSSIKNVKRESPSLSCQHQFWISIQHFSVLKRFHLRNKIYLFKMIHKNSYIHSDILFCAPIRSSTKHHSLVILFVHCRLVSCAFNRTPISHSIYENKYLIKHVSSFVFTFIPTQKTSKEP